MDISLLSMSISAGERASNSPSRIPVQYRTSKHIYDNGLSFTPSRKAIYNSPDVNVVRVGESMTDVTDKSEYVETRETESVDKAGWIVSRILELGGYETVSDSVKADIFGFDIADVGGSIRLFSDVMKRLEIKLDGEGIYKEFQRIYNESVGRDADKGKVGDKIGNRGREKEIVRL